MLDRLRQQVGGIEGELVALWERVVNVDGGSYCKRGVDELGRLMAGELERLGFSSQVVPETECGNHVLCRRPGSGRGRLFLSMHLDTVWPEGTVAEWPFRIENGRATGPGVADMKGGWILALHALSDEPAGKIVNVGIVRGGSARQVVADEVWLSVDLRAPDAGAGEAILTRVRELAAQPRTPGVTVEVTGGVTRPAWPDNPGTERLYGLARTIAADL